MYRVLVIEDNPANMELATVLLESAGHRIFSAENAADGISIARSEIPDLILLDIHLPDIDGFEAAAILKKDPITRSIPIIAVTAMAMRGDEAKTLAAGCDAYLSKPLHYKDLYRIIESLMANKNDSPKET